VSRDNLLWKWHLRRQFRPTNFALRSGSVSWRDEFERLVSKYMYTSFFASLAAMQNELLDLFRLMIFLKVISQVSPIPHSASALYKKERKLYSKIRQDWFFFCFQICLNVDDRIRVKRQFKIIKGC